MTRFSRVTILGSWRGMLKRSSFKFKSLYSKRRRGYFPISVTKFLAFQLPTICCWLTVLWSMIDLRFIFLNKPKSLEALLEWRFLVELFLLLANPASGTGGKLLFVRSSIVCISITVFLFLPVSNISIDVSIYSSSTLPLSAVFSCF